MSFTSCERALVKNREISRDCGKLFNTQIRSRRKTKWQSNIPKPEAPLKAIVSSMNETTEKITELAEYELRKFVDFH